MNWFTKKLPPVTPEELEYYIELFGAAMSMSMPVESPASKSFAINYGDGTTGNYRFTDHPLNRGLAALTSEIDDPVKGMSISYRIMYLNDIADDPAFSEYVQEDVEDNSIFIADSILFALARATFNKKGKIGRKQMKKLIAEYESLA